MVGTEVSRLTSFETTARGTKVRESYLGMGPSLFGGVLSGGNLNLRYDVGPKIILAVRSTMDLWDEGLPFVTSSGRQVVTTLRPVTISPIVFSLRH